MSAGVGLSERAAALLREAAFWRLLGLFFEAPRQGWAEEVTSLASTLPEEEDLRLAARLAAEEGSPSLYESLLGPGGPAAPRETSHRPEILPGPLLAEVAAYYENFSYAPALQEPPDHVAVECGFLGFLKLKEAFALEADQQEKALVAAEAFQSFLERHLREVAEPLAASLAPLGVFYLQKAAEELLRRTGPKPAQSLPPPPPEGAEEGCPFQD